jgi:hypothetical protein
MRLATKLRELLPFGILDLRTRLPLENHSRSRVFLRGANAMCNRLSDDSISVNIDLKSDFMPYDSKRSKQRFDM